MFPGYMGGGIGMGMGGMSGMPGMGSMGGMQMGGMGGMPGMPGMPGMGAMPAMPGMNGMNAVNGMAPSATDFSQWAAAAAMTDIMRANMRQTEEEDAEKYDDADTGFDKDAVARLAVEAEVRAEKDRMEAQRLEAEHVEATRLEAERHRYENERIAELAAQRAQTEEEARKEADKMKLEREMAENAAIVEEERKKLQKTDDDSCGSSSSSSKSSTKRKKKRSRSRKKSSSSKSRSRKRKRSKSKRKKQPSKGKRRSKSRRSRSRKQSKSKKRSKSGKRRRSRSSSRSRSRSRSRILSPPRVLEPPAAPLSHNLSQLLGTGSSSSSSKPADDRRRSKWDLSGDKSSSAPTPASTPAPKPAWLKDEAPMLGVIRQKVIRMQAVQIRCMLGVRGDTINFICNRSGADIKVKHARGEQWGNVSIVGNIEKTLEIIRSVLTEKGCPLTEIQEELKEGEEPKVSAVPRSQMASTPNDIDLPQELVGLFIGIGGANIKEIKAKVGGACSIKVMPPQDKRMPQKIQIAGDNVERARQLVRDHIDAVRKQYEQQQAAKNPNQKPAGSFPSGGGSVASGPPPPPPPPGPPPAPSVAPRGGAADFQWGSAL